MSSNLHIFYTHNLRVFYKLDCFYSFTLGAIKSNVIQHEQPPSFLRPSSEEIRGMQ